MGAETTMTLKTYTPGLNGTAFMGMFSKDGLYTGTDYKFYLAADVEQAQVRETLAFAAHPETDAQHAALRAEVEGLRRNKQIADALMLEGSQKMDEQRAQLAAMTESRDEMRHYHDCAIEALYDQLGIDKSDGEIRTKWVSLEISNLQQQLTAMTQERDELERMNASVVMERADFLLKLTASERRVKELQEAIDEARGAIDE